MKLYKYKCILILPAADSGLLSPALAVVYPVQVSPTTAWTSHLM